MKGYRKVVTVFGLGGMVCLLALAGVEHSAPYTVLGGLGAALCGANLFEHRGKP